MEQPIGDVLRRDAARGPVLHQGDVADVGHLGTPDSLIDPAHDVPEDPLGVVVELCLHLVSSPGNLGGDRDLQQVVERRSRTLGLQSVGQLLLPGDHIDAVVMGGVKGGGRRGGNPGAVGTR